MRTPVLAGLGVLVMMGAAQAQAIGAATGAARAPATTTAGRALYLEGIVWQGGGGRNSPIDLPRAEKLLRQAAGLGDAEAMDRLGDMYRDGEGGLSVDLAEARGWYEKEGAAGGAWGYYSLAEFYREGHGVEKDEGKAADLGKKAFVLAKERAEAGDLAAMDALAWCYLRGVGTEENEAEGMKWLKKAGEAEYPPSLLGLAWVGSRVNNEPEESLDLLMKAADKGIATAAEQAGVWYIEGVGMDPLPSEGLKWMNRAAAMGRSQTYGEIGRLYLRGQGVEKDLKKAVEFFEKGAAKGDAGAMRELAACYEDATGVEQDYAVAAKWYRKAAEQGDGASMYELAKLYELGTGVPADAGEARKWYEKAAGAGVVAAREWVEAAGK